MSLETQGGPRQALARNLPKNLTKAVGKDIQVPPTQGITQSLTQGITKSLPQGLVVGPILGTLQISPGTGGWKKFQLLHHPQGLQGLN